MARTLGQILEDVASLLDLTTQAATGDELSTRINYANQAVWDAASTGKISSFKKEYATGLTASATVSLPSDFRELDGVPQVLTSSGWISYPEIEVENKYEKSANDTYCYILGNPSEGYHLILNGHSAGTTLSLPYQKTPAVMATYSDVCELPDPQYVVKKIESYVLYARSDDRFSIANAMAEQRLANMMGKQMRSSGGMYRQTKSGFNNPLR
jgi:hypothetical protein